MREPETAASIYAGVAKACRLQRIQLVGQMTNLDDFQVSLRSGSQVPSDLRSYAMNLLYTIPPELLIPYIYPRLYALHLMPPEVSGV